MSETPFRLHLTGAAKRDIQQIDRYTVRAFGEPTALRYVMLIRQALRDIQEDPARPGATPRREVFKTDDVRVYHLALSRSRVSGQTVKQPRHFILFRQRPENVIEILRVLHDSRDLARHVQ